MPIQVGPGLVVGGKTDKALALWELLVVKSDAHRSHDRQEIQTGLGAVRGRHRVYAEGAGPGAGASLGREGGKTAEIADV